MPRLKAEKVRRIKADLCRPNATQPQVAKKHRVSRSAVNLRSEQEKKGPQRYLIDMGADEK